jgi:translation elongation factor EF-4
MLCWVCCQNKQEYVADEIGVLSPNQMEADELHAGEVTLLVLCSPV